ncbi:redoxin domain-containing protein [Sphingomonas segetis]|uniref:redoxin domain-containing protein n=1 Tax=Sphingomonas segetis TaxID=1104779 RepID=UPI001E2B73BD|nr:redoxin domain-containing protein [Sphingomonas segetis]
MNPAPEWQVAEWLNTEKPLSLADWRGRTLVALAFQMLCPGCVSQALPQLQRVRDTFPEDQVAVAAIHTVFEHHEAQGRTDVLRAFLHENRIRYPVAVDEPGPDGIPLTFCTYAMQGTPTLLLIDPAGRLRMQKFGHLDDLRLGAVIASVVAEGRLIDEPDAAS